MSSCWTESVKTEIFIMENKADVFFKSFTNSKSKRLDMLQTGNLSDCEFLVDEEYENIDPLISACENKSHEKNTEIVENLKNCKIDTTKLFRCHKMILAMSSEVFERMFYGKFEDETKPIFISDIRSEIFGIFLNYIYTYDLDPNKVTMKNLAELLYVADKYMVNDFAEVCVNIIKEKMWTISDILPTFELSCFYGDLKLMLISYEKICDNAMALLNHDTFLKLNVNNMKRLMILLTQHDKIIPNVLLNALKQYGLANGIFNRPFQKDYDALINAAYCLKLDKNQCKNELYNLIPNALVEPWYKYYD